MLIAKIKEIVLSVQAYNRSDEPKNFGQLLTTS